MDRCKTPRLDTLLQGPIDEIQTTRREKGESRDHVREAVGIPFGIQTFRAVSLHTWRKVSVRSGPFSTCNAQAGAPAVYDSTISKLSVWLNKMPSEAFVQFLLPP